MYTSIAVTAGTAAAPWLFGSHKVVSPQVGLWTKTAPSPTPWTPTSQMAVGMPDMAMLLEEKDLTDLLTGMPGPDPLSAEVAAETQRLQPWFVTSEPKTLKELKAQMPKKPPLPWSQDWSVGQSDQLAAAGSDEGGGTLLPGDGTALKLFNQKQKQLGGSWKSRPPAIKEELKREYKIAQEQYKHDMEMYEIAYEELKTRLKLDTATGSNLQRARLRAAAPVKSETSYYHFEKHYLQNSSVFTPQSFPVPTEIATKVASETNGRKRAKIVWPYVGAEERLPFEKKADEWKKKRRERIVKKVATFQNETGVDKHEKVIDPTAGTAATAMVSCFPSVGDQVQVLRGGAAVMAVENDVENAEAQGTNNASKRAKINTTGVTSLDVGDIAVDFDTFRSVEGAGQQTEQTGVSSHFGQLPGVAAVDHEGGAVVQRNPNLNVCAYCKAPDAGRGHRCRELWGLCTTVAPGDTTPQHFLHPPSPPPHTDLIGLKSSLLAPITSILGAGLPLVQPMPIMGIPGGGVITTAAHGNIMPTVMPDAKSYAPVLGIDAILNLPESITLRGASETGPNRIAASVRANGTIDGSSLAEAAWGTRVVSCNHCKEALPAMPVKFCPECGTKQ